MPSTDRAVLFDVDGVLVDSHRPHFESWRWVAAEFGHVLTEEAFRSTFGMTSLDIVRHVFEGRISDDEARTIDVRKEAKYRELVAEEYPLMPGAPALVDALRAEGFRIGLGSSGPRENVALLLEHLNRHEAIEAVVTGSDVTRGKPDPEIFATGSRQLGVSPDRCIVVEDAAAGVQAARAAGMHVLGIGATDEDVVRLEAERPDALVRRLDELEVTHFTSLVTAVG